MANTNKATKAITAVQAWTEIEEKANANAVNSIRIVNKMEIGKFVRQGDVYVVRVEDSHKCGIALKERQVAIGNTQGSRHIAQSPAQLFEGVAAPPKWSERTFLGPVIKSDKEWVLDHPEHAQFQLPAGTFQICHQMDARTLERVKD